MDLTSISWTDPKTLAIVAVIIVAIAVAGYMAYAWQTKHWPFS